MTVYINAFLPVVNIIGMSDHLRTMLDAQNMHRLSSADDKIRIIHRSISTIIVPRLLRLENLPLVSKSSDFSEMVQITPQSIIDTLNDTALTGPPRTYACIQSGANTAGGEYHIVCYSRDVACQLAHLIDGKLIGANIVRASVLQ